jgi:ATP-dependent RNA helicase RhlE
VNSHTAIGGCQTATHAVGNTRPAPTSAGLSVIGRRLAGVPGRAGEGPCWAAARQTPRKALDVRRIMCHGRRVNFSDLGLLPSLVRAVTDAGYTDPTPIQVEAIPPALAGRDIVGCARTGTGKTAAFALPILQRIDALAGEDPKIRALILTPTRELAAQIGDSFARYGKHLELWHAVIFGGVGQAPQEKEVKRGIDILVATPGRLLDLINQRIVKLDDIQIFVLDEADRMLDMGFLPDVRRIVATLPKVRQTLFFSATMPPEIRGLAESLLRDPVSIAVSPVSSAAEKVVQKVCFVDKDAKRNLLVHLLRAPEVERALVFSRTKHGANRVAEHLSRSGIAAAAIHGNKSQGARTRALDGFRSGELPILVATDIAARGIDVSGVTHVINFDLPNIPETYVHRIGRTGRADASGIAVSFCDSEERAFLVDIERLLGEHIERIDNHPFPPSQPPPPETSLGRREPGAPRPQGPARQGPPRQGPPRTGGGGGRGRRPGAPAGNGGGRRGR